MTTRDWWLLVRKHTEEPELLGEEGVVLRYRHHPCVMKFKGTQTPPVL